MCTSKKGRVGFVPRRFGASHQLGYLFRGPNNEEDTRILVSMLGSLWLGELPFPAEKN